MTAGRGAGRAGAAVPVLALALWGAPGAARAGHTLLTDEAIPGTTLRHRHVRFDAPVFEAHVVVLPPGRYRARIADQPEPGFFKAPPVSVLTARARAAVGINGGYFEPDFKPTGLLVVSGVTVFPAVARPLLSGVLYVGATGALELRRRDEPLTGARFALQSGPFLIDPPEPPAAPEPGTPARAGTVGIRKPGPVAPRTVLALSARRELAVISTSMVSLLDLAGALAQEPAAFGLQAVERALNLDGGPSTALSIPALKEPVRIEALTPVRTAILFWDAPGKRKPARPRPAR